MGVPYLLVEGCGLNLTVPYLSVGLILIPIPIPIPVPNLTYTTIFSLQFVTSTTLDFDTGRP